MAVTAKAEVCPEPDNKFDSNAIKLAINGKKIGNVNRLMLSTFHRWLSTGTVEAVIERIEGTAERPRVFVLDFDICHFLLKLPAVN